MEDQSPYVTSSSFGNDAEEQPRGAAEAKRHVQPWDDDMDDVLDLTGGAGQFSHPSFSVTFPAKGAEDEEEKRSYSDSLEPSPEEEEPSSIGSDVPRVPVIPSAPEEERPPAPYSAPSRSVDVNLFPIPASSAPLMHSSSDLVMDLQQPSSTIPAGQEEFSSLLLESATSLHSLSPLSADSPKEQLVAFPADSTTPEAFKDPISDQHAMSRTIGDFPIAEKLGSGMGYQFPQVTDHKSTSGEQEKMEDLFFSEKGHAIEHPTAFLESATGDHTKLYTQSAKEMFSGMLKSVGPPHEEFSDLTEGLDEQYVDFKPFASTGGLGIAFEPKEVSVDYKSNVNKSPFESTIKLEDKYNEERDVDVSDDISPASPEAISDSSNYDMFAPLQQTNPFAFGGNQVKSDNITDEKKMEDLKSHVASSRLGSNVATVNPFLVDQDEDYVTTDTVQGSVTSKPEGLTPDIVQEAYESEVHDAGVSKLGYEPKIDLVQTAAKAAQETISPSVQSIALFEDTDSISSPVLPDIVMEAPATSAPVGLSAVAPQPDVSPVGHMAPVSEEKLKFESEKPPSYEEAINKASAKEQDQVPVHVESVKEPIEEPETPYISIACDLVKETIPEQVATDFSKALKSEFDSQFSSHFEDSSPESDQSEPSYKLWEAEVISKEAANTTLAAECSVTPEKEQLGDMKWKEPSPARSYLESVEPEPYVFKKVADVKAEEPVAQTSIPDKLLQMEEFGKAEYSKDFEIPSIIPSVKEISKPHREEQVEITAPKWLEDEIPKEQPKVKEEISVKEKTKESSDKVVDLSKAGPEPLISEEPVSKPLKPAKDPSGGTPASKDQREGSPATVPFKNSVVDLVYWRDIKKSGAVFGASLFLLLSLTVFSIVSVAAYIALALLSVSISFRIYKGVLQAIQKSEEGHPFKAYLDSNVAVSEDLVQKYCSVALSHINCTIKELRRLFLVEDLVDSLKFAVLMWVFTYIGALFNGLTLLILALISLFSIPVIYERHQTQIDHYLSLINKNVKNTSDLILSKIPGLKRKAD